MVLTAILMVVLILFVALVVDLGNARDVRRQSQNGGDAAALAGAAALYPNAVPPSPPQCQSGGAPPCIPDAVSAARLYALKNFQVSSSDWSACTAALLPGYVASPGTLGPPVTSGTSCISYYPATSPTTVRVVMPARIVPSFFGAIIGSSSIPVGSLAQAGVSPQVTCSLCFLGNVDAGNGDYSVTGGSIAVNGTVTAGPNSVWNSQSNGVSGTVIGGNFTPTATTIPTFGDPLATTLTLPLITTGLPARTNPCALPPAGGPGVYGPFSAFPNSTCTLQPGLYVITGKWTLGNFPLSGTTGVTLYAKSSSPFVSLTSGFLDFKNGDPMITAPTAAQVAVSGGLAGYAIIYDRDNTNPLGLQGNGNTLITGSIYAPASILDGNGNSCYGLSGGPFVFGGGYSNGNPGCVTVTNAKSVEVTAKGLQLTR